MFCMEQFRTAQNNSLLLNEFMSPFKHHTSNSSHNLYSNNTVLFSDLSFLQTKKRRGCMNGVKIIGEVYESIFQHCFFLSTVVYLIQVRFTVISFAQS